MTRPAVLVNLKVDEASFVDRGANPESDIVLFKRATLTETSMTLIELLAAADADLKSAVEEAISLRDAEIETLKAAVPQPEVEEVQLSDTAKVELAKRDAEIADLRKRFEASEASRLMTEFIGKAEGYTNSGVETNRLAVLMKNVQTDLDEADYETLTELLDASEGLAQASDNLTEEVGKLGDDAPNSPAVKLEKIARDLMKSTPELTYAKAYDQALRENAELYKAHRSETPSRKV